MVKGFLILSVRSVCKHPFLVGMAFLLIFMYRSFPLFFSLFLSASPVIVSTALLLATLLSFGHPNIPEIEKRDTINTTTTTHRHLSLRSAGFGESDSIIVSKDRGFDEETERYYTDKEKQKDSGDEENEVVETSVRHKDASSDVDDHVSEYSLADGGASVTKENSIQQETEEAVDESVGRGGFEHEIEDYLDKESPLSQVMNNHYSQIQHSDDEERSDMEKDKIPEEGSVGDQRADDVDADEDDDDDDEEEDEEEEASDSGSDGAESSSPDASMADIIPMLDELHPLLDEEHPQTALMSHDGSDAASEHSLASGHNTESDDDDGVANHAELEVEEDEEEETHADKEDETKSAISWTEDDQKNLMNLGTSELERNQRLENLIARRRARKNMRLMAEKNLIDLESADLPFNIAPISTARNNPFDLPYDSNDNIPGSAPSILLPRRNPFDLPYDSSEEKPDLAGDTFQQDFVAFHHQPKEPFFRRHESFNVGPSVFGAPRQERQEYKLRPYFIPERMAMEGTSYSFFQRQSSELSESKMSSVPDTESNSSVGDLEDMKVTEEDLSQEPELISVADHVSHLVGHGSQSSEDGETVELGQVESRDVELDGIQVRLGDFEDHQEVDSSLSEPESEATPKELHINEIHLQTEALEQKHSSRSSSSSSPEINEENAIENEKGEVLLEQTRNIYPHTDPSIYVQPLMEMPQFDFTSLMVEENQHKEPVYDSSPPAVKTNPTFSTDLQVESSQMGLHSIPENEEKSFAELEFGSSNQGLEKENPDIEVVLLNSAERNEVDDTNFTSRSLTDVSKHDTRDQIPSSLDEDVHQHLMAVEKVSSIESRDKEVNIQFEQVHEVADKKLVSTYQSISDEESASQPEKELPLLETSKNESSSEHPKKELDEFDDKTSRMNMDPSEFQERDDKVAPNNNFTETEAPQTSADLQDVEVGSHVEDIEEEEDWNFSSQLLTESRFDGGLPNNIEDVVEEIDENLLRELDTVGDFSINDLNGGSFLEESFNDSSIHDVETKVKVDEEDHQLLAYSRSSEDHTGVSEPQISTMNSPKNSESSDIVFNVQVRAAVTYQGAESSSDEEDSSSRVFDVKQDKVNSSNSISGSSSTHSPHDSGDQR